MTLSFLITAAALLLLQAPSATIAPGSGGRSYDAVVAADGTGRSAWCLRFL